MSSVENFDFAENGKQGFFNEFELDIDAAIAESGVYKLKQNKQGLFVGVEKVTEVVENDAQVVDGRISIIGEEFDYLYVKFSV